MAVRISSGSSVVKLACLDAALAAFSRDVKRRPEALHDRRHVVAGVAVRHVAAERADVAHLGVGNQERGLAQDRDLDGEIRGADQLVLGGQGTDHHVAAVGADALEVRQAGEVDQVVGGREAQLHHRDQAVPARDGARALSQLGEQRDRILDRCGPMVGE
jgi:hypothetical protein